MQDNNSTQYYYDLIKNSQSKEEREQIQKQIMQNREASFLAVFNRCMFENNITTSDLVKDAELLLSRSVIYHYLDGSRNPTRDRVLVLTLAGKFSLEQTEECLKALQYSLLRPKYPRENIIMNCIMNGDKPLKVNTLLFEKGLKVLVPFE